MDSFTELCARRNAEFVPSADLLCAGREVDIGMSERVNVLKLKELLRSRDLPTTGRKTELIVRLREHDPDALSGLGDGEEESSVVGDDVGADDRSDVANEGEAWRSIARVGDANRELELVRRERDLLRRELELMRRKTESGGRRTNRSPVTGDHGGGVGGLRDLLSEFDGTNGEFWRWRQQVELLCATYNLDNNASRVLISSRLRGKALSWFHSSPEHIVPSTMDLLERMRQLFDHRPGRLALRKEFERRTWQAGESFSEYYHSKIILANRVPIEGSSTT